MRLTKRRLLALLERGNVLYFEGEHAKSSEVRLADAGDSWALHVVREKSMERVREALKGVDGEWREGAGDEVGSYLLPKEGIDHSNDAPIDAEATEDHALMHSGADQVGPDSFEVEVRVYGRAKTKDGEIEWNEVIKVPAYLVRKREGMVLVKDGLDAKWRKA